MLATPCLAAEGDLDTSFDTDGVATANFPGNVNDSGRALGIQADGKIVMFGLSNSNLAVTRFLTNGTVDDTFGTGGFVTTDAGGTDYGYSMALQADGKIVGSGSVGGNFVLVRYNTDGSLDTDFDTDGMLTTDFGGILDEAYSVTIDSNGKIVAGGSANNDFGAARYNADGSLDNTFSGDGMVRVDFGGVDRGRAVAVDADDKVLIGGWFGDFSLARLNTDGSLDNAFDTDGKVTTDVGGTEEAWVILVQSDGKILLGGKGDNNFALVRYNTDGSLDNTFDTDGIVTTDLGGSDWAYALAQQHDGKIVAAGCGNGDLAVVRYNTDGSLDATFGTGGIKTQHVGAMEYIYALKIGTDRKIVAGGNALIPGGSADFVVMRLIGDAVAPTVTVTSPVDGATDVAVNAVVTATFDDDMDSSSLTGATFTLSGGVTGTITYDSGNKKATFTPDADLSYDTEYNATLTTGATDVAGNGLAAPKVWTLTTGTAPDTTAPTIDLVSPLDGAENEAVNTAITARFDEPMLVATMNATTFTLKDSGANPVNGTVTYDAPSRTITLTPDADLAQTDLHTATISTDAKDEAGNPLAAPKVWTFTTISLADVTAPTITGTNPANGAANAAVDTALTATFDEDMNASTIKTTTFTVNNGVTGTVTYDAGTRKATFVPSADLDHATTYMATVTTGVKDLAGNALAEAKTWIFTTVADAGDTDGDGVSDIVDTYPADAAKTGLQSVSGVGKIILDTSANAGTGITGAKAKSDVDPQINQTNKPAKVQFPYGLVQFQVTGVAVGGTIQVKVIFPDPLPDDIEIYKVGSAGFYDYAANAVINNNEIILTLTDGGAGDADGVANGVIADPVGITTPVGESRSSGGTGCVFNPNAGFGLDWVLLLLGLGLALVGPRFGG